LTRSDGTRVGKDIIGLWGEHLAARWLRKHGRKVLYCNYRASGGGEVDIVARHKKLLTFVEVKTRTSTERGRPAEAVNADKEKLILRGANAWLRMLDETTNIPTRCDIVEVILRHGEKAQISIIEGAFRIDS
jgi:putative endonuclease